jgi:hypothetical protein
MSDSPSVRHRQKAAWHIGQDVSGRWIVRDVRGLHGGIFNSRAAALRFALRESDHNVAIMEPNILSLSAALAFAANLHRPRSAGKSQPLIAADATAEFPRHNSEQLSMLRVNEPARRIVGEPAIKASVSG